jgi:elongation factor P
VSMAADIIKEEMRYIKEGTECALMYWNDQLIGITPPKNVILEVTQTDPAARGNTATNVTKPAILETGAEVQVPSFITAGEKVKIQVETGAYLGRAQ